MNAGWNTTARYRCADCGSAAGDPCTDWCPSAIATETIAAENHDPAYAAEIQMLGELGTGVAA